MSFRYSLYRKYDTACEWLRSCFKWKPEDNSREVRELRQLVGDHFYAALIRTPYSEIDVRNHGAFDMSDFTNAFQTVAPTDEQLTLVFRLVDQNKDGTVTYGEWQQFQRKVDPEGRGNRDWRGRFKWGCPDFLEYSTLLDGLLTSCSRFPLAAKLAEANEPFPPSVQWLTRAMAAEWDTPKLRSHWVYATSPVPDTEEGRRFPDWNGGFTVRDEGHVGMTTEDFCCTAMATTAGLTMPEVVGLRLYTGPGYEALNLSLRANSQRFPVAEYCIDSAIGKLAQVAPQKPLLRGMRKPMDPRWVRLYSIYRGVGRKRLALSDPGFVSTTTDIRVATGKDFGGPIIFALHTLLPSPLPECGFLSNGADVQWVSQYPSESEILLPSNVIFVPRLRCKHTRKHGLQIPPEKRVFEFQVFYPWDFDRNCPLVTDDFRTCANALLDHVHGLDVVAVEACRAGHATGVPTLALPSPHNPPAPSPPAHEVPVIFWSSPVLFPPTELAEGPLHCASPVINFFAHPSSGGSPVLPSIYATFDDQLHIPAELLPNLTDPSAPVSPTTWWAQSPSPTAKYPHTSAAVSATILRPRCNPCPAVASGPHPGSPTGPLMASVSAVGRPSVDSAVSPVHSYICSFSDFSGSLSGSDALRLAAVRHYTQAEVDAALQRLRGKPAHDDGLEAVGLVGNSFPRDSGLLMPFENSAWDVGFWGITAGTVSAGLATLGLGAKAAAAVAAGVTVTLVAVTAVPLTVLHAPQAVPNPTGTPTPTLTSSTSVTATSSTTLPTTSSATASPTRTASRTPSATPSATESPTRTATQTPSATASPTRTASRTPSATPSATESPTRTATQTPSVPVVCSMWMGASCLSASTTDSSLQIVQIDFALRITSVSSYGIPVVSNSKRWTIFLGSPFVWLAHSSGNSETFPLPSQVVVSDGKWHKVSITGSAMAIDGHPIPGFDARADISSTPVYSSWCPYWQFPPSDLGSSVGAIYELAAMGITASNTSMSFTQRLKFSANSYIVTPGPFVWTSTPPGQAALSCKPSST